MERRKFPSRELARKILVIALLGAAATAAGAMLIVFVEGGLMSGIAAVVAASVVEVVLILRVIRNFPCPRCSAALSRDPEGFRCQRCGVHWVPGIRT